MTSEETRKEESQKAVLAAYLSLSIRGKDITPENLVRESLQVSSFAKSSAVARRATSLGVMKSSASCGISSP